MFFSCGRRARKSNRWWFKFALLSRCLRLCLCPNDDPEVVNVVQGLNVGALGALGVWEVPQQALDQSLGKRIGGCLLAVEPLWSRSAPVLLRIVR
jgi:hypothetical protein